MTLRLTEAESRALRRLAEHEGRAELLDRVLDEVLLRYVEALERLGQ